VAGYDAATCRQHITHPIEIGVADFPSPSPIFGDDVSVKSSHDPEFPGETYTVLSPQVSADSAAILRMESEWVERVARLAPNGHGFRLRIQRKE